MKLKHVLISSVSLIQGCPLRGLGFTNKGTHTERCQMLQYHHYLYYTHCTSYQCSHQPILYEAITFVYLLRIKCNVHSLHTSSHCNCTLQCTMFQSTYSMKHLASAWKYDMLDVTNMRQTRLRNEKKQQSTKNPGPWVLFSATASLSHSSHTLTISNAP